MLRSGRAMARRASPEFATNFVESMPKAYRGKYSPDEVMSHASVSAFRDGKVVDVGLFGRAGNGVVVVADDRPGLLASLSAGLLVSHYDVSHAEVYTRTGSNTGGGKSEAVDLFWVRKLDKPPGAKITQADAEELRAKLEDYITGKGNAGADVERELSRAAANSPPVSLDATVRFQSNDSGSLTTLEVETSDRSGLLYSLASALYGQHVQIVESEVRTVDGRVLDRFRIVELDGAPIGNARRLEIQVAVLNAIEPARRSGPPPA